MHILHEIWVHNMPLLMYPLACLCQLLIQPPGQEYGMQLLLKVAMPVETPHCNKNVRFC